MQQILILGLPYIGSGLSSGDRVIEQVCKVPVLGDLQSALPFTFLVRNLTPGRRKSGLQDPVSTPVFKGFNFKNTPLLMPLLLLFLLLSQFISLGSQVTKVLPSLLGLPLKSMLFCSFLLFPCQDVLRTSCLHHPW
jgi:hypothetical protein